MRLLLATVLFFSSLTSHAFIKDADKFADQFVWKALMDKVTVEGEVSYSFISELRALTKIIEIEKDKSHQAVYLTTSGRTSMMSGYVILEVSVSSEVWTLMEDGKTWHVDQWFYYFTANGDYRYSMHKSIEKEDVTVKKIEQLPVTETLEEQEAAARALLNLFE